MTIKVYIEEAEDLMRESPTYRKILEHRRNCKKWGKEFCLKCFGGGLTRFIKGIREELYFKQNNTGIKCCRKEREPIGYYSPPIYCGDYIKGKLKLCNECEKSAQNEPNHLNNHLNDSNNIHLNEVSTKDKIKQELDKDYALSKKGEKNGSS